MISIHEIHAFELQIVIHVVFIATQVAGIKL